MAWKLNWGAGADQGDRATQVADLVIVLLFFCFVLLVENVLVILWAWAVPAPPMASDDRTYGFFGIYSIAMLCSGAASLAGGLIGFLFGIPRSDDRVSRTTVAAGPAPPSPPLVEGTARTDQVSSPGLAGVGLRRNTNLETISDGLTKGLLGIGVSQLYRAPEAFKAVADALGPAFGPGTSGKVVGMAVVLYGLGSGFFFGYLSTRIYLTRVFERNDPR